MSMENGFELDFPGNDDNAENCEFGCMPMDHGEIGEPDAASNDEMPRVITKIENPELVLSARASSHWERTATVIERPAGHSTHKLSFVTEMDHGSYTTTVRLTQVEAIEAWYAIGRHLGLMPR